MKNLEIYEELKKEFDLEEIVAVVYAVYKFKVIDNVKWNEQEVADTAWWKAKYEELVNNIELVK